MAEALISLGSNIEPRRHYLNDALTALDRGPCTLKAVSSLFETAPVDVSDQADFLNLAVAVETALDPQALLRHMKGIEKEAGKKIARRRGPRTLDLDLLLYGEQRLGGPDLVLPHERMHQRAFVLAPLAQIRPKAMHPVIGKTVEDLLRDLNEQQIIRDLGPLDRS